MRIDNPQLSGSIFATGSTFLTGSVTINDYSLPLLDGIDRQILKTDGSGNITFGYPEDITVTVKNVSGTTLQKGTPVHVTGSAGNTSEVIAASASIADTMPATFILNETLANEAEGEALIAGFIQGVNTDGFIPGAVVYVGPYGGYVQTRPTGSNLIQNLGIITKAHPTNGSGVVLGAGRSNDVPNIQPGYTWVGNTSHRAIPVPTSSLSVAFATSASYALSASHEITYEKSSSYADFALTASFALNAGGGAGAGFPFSGSAEITGSLFVSGGNISGSFVGDGAGLTGITINEFATFEDTFTNATSHSAVHNFNTKNVFVQVFEDDDTLLIPNSVTTTDVNTVDIVFGDTLSGRVVIGKAGHLLQDTGNFASSSTAVQTFTNATTASINHGLNSENVITQVFDLNGNVIVPSNIKVANSNTVQLTFASVRSGKAVVAKAGHIVSSTASTELSNNLIPSIDETYDLGSPTKKWKDLYLSGSTIHLGDTKISSKPGGGLLVTDNLDTEVSSGIADRVQAGSSGSRDLTTPQSGSLWFNTNRATLEVYSGASGSGWVEVGNLTTTSITATGGTITTSGAYTQHTFASSGDFTINIGDTDGEVEYLIVAGGGGGGGGNGANDGAGGGGAGGMLTGTTNLTSTTYSITVGGGGSGGATGVVGTSGQDSSAFTLTAVGGGFGGGANISGGDGGSGGADGGGGGVGQNTGTIIPGSGTAGQGNDGGESLDLRQTYSLPAAGGGGKSSVGEDSNVSTTRGGHGGAGEEWPTGSGNYYAGGGGGAGGKGGSPGTVDGGNGGIGGGGDGGDNTGNHGDAGAGTANTGGGGGGGRNEGGSQTGGAGGSGIVIIRYLT